MKTFGDDVISLFRVARHSALIVAPFMRSSALARLLDSIPVGTDTTVVTRWRPADLLAGASDLGVYDLAESRAVPLYLRHDLHAKFFAADDMCLIGSANVTDTALGWRSPANLELLAPIARTADHIVEFEAVLLAGALRATAEHRAHLEELIEKLRGLPVLIPGREDDGSTMGLLSPSWVPRLRNPEDLYSVYSGECDVGRSALPTMQEELAKYGTVPGMSEETFRTWIAASIIQTPLVSRVLQRIDEEGQVTEAALSDLLAEIGADDKEYHTRDVLEILKRWLTYFLPTQYETTQDSIKLIKAKKL